MTTPNQTQTPWGSFAQSSYGDYAWEIGGGQWHYGQSLTEDEIAMIIHGPKANPDNVYALFQDKLLQQPLEVLRMFQPFIKNTTVEEHFPDIPVSVSTIMKWLPDNPLVLSMANAQQWVTDTFQPLAEKVQSIIDAIIQGFHAWWEQNGFTKDDVSQFSNNVAQAIGTIGTLGIRLSKLEGAQAKVFEDFTTYANDKTTLGPKWFQYYEGSGGGTLGIINDYAIFDQAPFTRDKYAYALHKTAVDTDSMRVAAPMSTPQAGIGAEDSANYLIARAALAVGSDHIFARFEKKKAWIGYYRAGKTTVLGEIYGFEFKNGAVYSLDCTEQRTYRLFENDTKILEVVDSAGMATTGPNNRYGGIGTYAPNGNLRPGAFGSFAVFTK